LGERSEEGSRTNHSRRETKQVMFYVSVVFRTFLVLSKLWVDFKRREKERREIKE
jgi:hypothetical protein